MSMTRFAISKLVCLIFQFCIKLPLVTESPTVFPLYAILCIEGQCILRHVRALCVCQIELANIYMCRPIGL